MCRGLIQSIRRSAAELDDMAKRANDILTYFGIGDCLDGVPIVEILMKMGFKIYQSNLSPDGISAYIAIDPKLEETFKSNKIICVHANDSLGHKRFALAHELCHYLFDFNEAENVSFYNTYFADSSEETEAEKRANRFAAELLMPAQIFRQKYDEYQKLQSKADIVSALARYFVVSPTAVLRRFDEVGITGYSESVG